MIASTAIITGCDYDTGLGRKGCGRLGCMGALAADKAEEAQVEEASGWVVEASGQADRQDW